MLGRSVALVLADRAVTSRLLVELHSRPLAELAIRSVGTGVVEGKKHGTEGD